MEISGRVISIESRICQLTCALQLEFGSFQGRLCPSGKFIRCLSRHQSLSALPKHSERRLLINQKRFPVLGRLRNHDATQRTMPITKKHYFTSYLCTNLAIFWSHRLLFLSDTKLNLGQRGTVEITNQKFIHRGSRPQTTQNLVISRCCFS